MSKSSDWYDADYFERARESGKGGFTGAYTWGRLSGYFADTACHILRSFSPKTVLDVGCAKGYMVSALRDLGVEAYGLDFSDYAIRSCRPATKDFLETYDIVEGSNASLANLLNRRKFSVVFSSDMMEHINEESIDKVLKRLASLSTEYLVLNIGLEYPEYNEMTDMDKSHCCVHFRDWWVNKLVKNCKEFKLLPENSFINSDVWWFNVPGSLFILKKIELPA